MLPTKPTSPATGPRLICWAYPATSVRLHLGGEEYVVKRPNLSPDAPPRSGGVCRRSSFDFERQARHLPRLLGQLDKSISRWRGWSRSAKPGDTSFSPGPGRALRAGCIPPQDAYISSASLWAASISGGARATAWTRRALREPFGQQMLTVMDQLIQRFWADKPAVRQGFESCAGRRLSRKYFCPIMPDTSRPTRFVYAPDLSRSPRWVDCDAYVAGPASGELCVVELCLEAGEDFQRGYETCQPLPSLAPSRDFTGYTPTYDPWEAGDPKPFCAVTSLFS